MSNVDYKTMLKYSNLGLQIVIGLLLLTYFGKWIDEKIAMEKPMFTWILPLLFLIGYLIKIIKETSKSKKSKLDEF